ncbi:MAG: AAA family ATPase, partial [Pseudomonadota bacterium]|nr:AAA family ATPase [Pseudomonadota bacterium]
AQTAQAYFDLAGALLEPRPARLIAIGGLSGSGKTTVAEALAPHIGTPPGARIGESDRLRKAMFRVPPDMRLDKDAYRPEISRLVYDRLAELARTITGDGGTMVVDAVFDDAERRDAIERAARDAGVKFAGIWLDADPAILRQRVAARHHGPSDATVDVLDRQLARFTGDIGWKRIAAAQAPQDVVRDILNAAESP